MAKKNGYHREDLRADLVRAGHEFVAEFGHESLSVRALAQRVNVSAGAPYHHFPDRRSLLLALALDGFRRLWERADGVKARSLSASDSLSAFAIAFLDFQSENPRLLELMYESELTRPDIDPAIVEQQLLGFTLLRNAIDRARPGLSIAEQEARSVAFWSAIYGYASLLSKGLLRSIISESGSVAGWQSALVRQSVTSAIGE